MITDEICGQSLQKIAPRYKILRTVYIFKKLIKHLGLLPWVIILIQKLV